MAKKTSKVISPRQKSAAKPTVAKKEPATTQSQKLTRVGGP